MPERKSFLLRVDRELLDAVQRWAGDDLRSLNGQVEFLLRRALQQAGRMPSKGAAPDHNAIIDENEDDGRPAGDDT